MTVDVENVRELLKKADSGSCEALQALKLLGPSLAEVFIDVFDELEASGAMEDELFVVTCRVAELEQRYADVVSTDDAARAELVRVHAERGRLICRKHFGEPLTDVDIVRLAEIEGIIDAFELEELAPSLRRMERISAGLQAAVEHVDHSKLLLDYAAAKKRVDELSNAIKMMIEAWDG